MSNAADVEVARSFLDAFGSFDAERAMTYVAHDADPKGMEGFPEQGSKSLSMLTSFLEAFGWKQTITSCEALEAALPTDTTVVCAFDYQGLRSDELDRGPFSGSEFVITVRGSEIVKASWYWNIQKFSRPDVGPIHRLDIEDIPRGCCGDVPGRTDQLPTQSGVDPALGPTQPGVCEGSAGDRRDVIWIVDGEGSHARSLASGDRTTDTTDGTGEHMDRATFQHRGYRRGFQVASIATALAFALIFASTLSAGAAGEMRAVTDPAGDATYKAPSYMDILGAKVTKSGQTFIFEMTVAQPIPAKPAASPPASAQMGWAWPLDTDPSTYPAGPPVAPGTGAPAELIVGVIWDGRSFSASLNDRRPLLAGGEVILTPLPFTVSGGQVRVDVRASALGNPATFGWRPVTFYWSAPFGSNNGNHFVDSTDSYIPFP